MLVAVCSDTGSPGVTTTALALGAMWPGDEVSVVELDLSGGDLGLRLRDRGHATLPVKPTVVALAAAARGGGSNAHLAPYALPIGEGLSVVQAPMVREGMGILPQLMPAVARAFRASDGDTVVDIGRIDTSSPELGVAAAADTLVVVARDSAVAVRRLKERLALLLSAIAAQRGGPIPAYVVLVCPRRHGRGHVGEIRAYLADEGVTVDGVGFIGWDPAGVGRIERGGNPRGKQVRRTTLGRTATRVAQMVRTRSTESSNRADAPMSQGV